MKTQLIVPTLITLISLMTGCIGTSNTPVVYNEPTNNGNYEVSTFQPSVTFPDGLPVQTNVTIELNGVDITDEFNDWGSGITNTARVTLAINGTNTPIIAAALRDGRNVFQVSKPNKSLVAFNVDLPGAEVHITLVEDNWTGKMTDAKPGVVTVSGYLEGENYSNITSMSVRTSALDSNGDKQPNTGQGTFMIANVGTTTTDGAFSLTLNNDYTFSFVAYDVGDNDGVYDPADADVVTITVTDDSGISTKDYLRSNVPLYNQRLGNNGSFALAFDQVALRSTAEGIEDALDGMSQDIIVEDIPIVDNVCIGFMLFGNCIGFRLNITADLYMYALTINNSVINLTTPVQNNPTTGQIDINVDLPVTLGAGSRIDVLEGFISCTLSNATIQYDADLVMYVDGANETQVSMNNPNLDTGGLVGGNILCNLVDAAASNLFDGMIVGIISDVVEVVFNKDLPLLRLVVKIQDAFGNYLLGPSYLSFNPVMSNFFNVPNSWDNAGSPGNGTYKQKWGLNLGMHTYGNGATRIPSLGSRYKKAVLPAPSLSIDGTEANDRTLGAILSENFINQLLLGLWESGILYVDQSFDFPGGIVPINAFLSDVRFKFASMAPWDVDILPTDSPEGDLLLTVPDLVIEFSGDRYWPNYVNDYVFAYMVADVKVYLNLGVAPGKGALRLQSASAVEISVKEISSDWDGTTEAQMAYVFDLVMTQLLGTGAWDIPFPVILSSEVEIGDVWSDDGRLNATIDVYNGTTYCNGPDKPEC